MDGTAPLFDRSVEKWLLYTESVRGRLLRELAWHHLEGQLGSGNRPRRVLDAGCGLGDTGLRFCGAEKLVLLDSSEKMIAMAKKRVAAQKPAFERERITFIHSAVEEMESFLPEGSFDLIVCHNTLEYTEAPEAAFGALVERLAPRGILSLVVANRFSEPFKLALTKSDLAGARRALRARTSTADLFESVRKHTFSFKELDRMAGDLDLEVVARRGIRIFADYLPEDLIEAPGNFESLLALEKEAGAESPYILVARHLQVISRHKGA